ncbi:hypothetical protein [Hoeflea sp.]|uniref:hypothetical protein n=1 Tax=Hoeflea sp. TaxID=1940281 RepID=UPI0025BC7C03|nr:hypothetical protein [Hoeflea sp.]
MMVSARVGMPAFKLMAGAIAALAWVSAAFLLAPGLRAFPASPLVHAPVERRISAPEARQGVASDGEAIYAVDNSTIGKYAIADGRRLVRFEGDPERFAHLNSCTIVERQLVCAASNYPDTPHRGTVEFFAPETLAHLRSVPLPENPGSLTVLTRHGGKWWAIFANYDSRGGVPGQDHRATLLAELDEDFRILRRFTFPQSVLGRIAPRSISGASWGRDGKLYVSGHDKPEIYVLELPRQGKVLCHIGSFDIASFGQAIDFDPLDNGLLWSIDRETRTAIASRVPPLG